MVPLVKFPVISLGEPRTEPLIDHRLKATRQRFKCFAPKSKQRTIGPVNAYLVPGSEKYECFIHVNDQGHGSDNPLGTKT